MTLYIRPDGSKAVEIPNALPSERKKLRRAARSGAQKASATQSSVKEEKDHE